MQDKEYRAVRRRAVRFSALRAALLLILTYGVSIGIALSLVVWFIVQA